MKFSFKRAVLTGAILWVLIFFEVSILMFGFGMKDPMSSWAHQILLFALTIFACWFYFKSKKVEREVQDGFKLGLTMLLTGVLLDAIITVPLFVKSYSFFNSGLLWAGYIEGFVIAVLYSMFEKKRKRRK